MKSLYNVKFMKYFVDGLLKGVSIDQEVNFDTLDAATQYVAFLNRHTMWPVEGTNGSSPYTCHCIRIETEGVTV